MSTQPVHEVLFERHLGEGPPTLQSAAISEALGARPAQPVRWTWRCSCGANGDGSHVDAITEGRQHQLQHAPILHVRSQDDQPYGSERRCCNHCGIMLWGGSSPPYVDNWTDWRAHPNNCGKERAAS